jgi:peptidyl-prolyl cis-trans isomerase D
MLDFFRAVTKSRIGAAIGLAFLVLIVLAFAGADVGGMRTGSLIGGENVASVGAARITTGELEKTLRASYDSERQRTPTLTMKDFLAQGALDDVLTGLIDRAATWEWGKKYGFGVSDRLIDSEIAKLPAFQGADGKFSQDAYKQLLAQRGLTDQLVRDDIAKGLMSKLVFSGAAEGATMPGGVTQVYAALVMEKRTGNLLALPATLFEPKVPATEQQIGDFYKANIARYQRPERRTIRYALIDDGALRNVPPPTEDEIRKRYQANAELYASGETRSVTQVILPTEAAAKAFASEVAGGKSLEAAASAKGLAAARIESKTRDQIARDSNAAVADALFAAAQGKTIAPVKGVLGWVVARVDAISRKVGKTMDQARPEIVTALTAEKHKAALTELATRIGEKAESGTSLTDIARTFALTVATSPAVQADGTLPDKAGEKLSPDLQPLLQAAFAMEREGQPQIAGLPGGTRAVVFDVGTISAATPAPLAEIKATVAADWARQQGAQAGSAAADKVLAALAKKTPLADAAKSLGVAVPQISPLSFTRAQLSQMQGRVPPALALLFSMAKGTAKKLAAPNQAGWIVVVLDDIEPGKIGPNDPIVEQAAGDLGKATGREYQEQLRTAIAHEIGAKRNPAAVATVRTNLTGGGQ